MEHIYKLSREYHKASVLIMEICAETTIQGHLWEKDEGWEQRKRLMSIMDEINGRFGRGTLEIAGGLADAAEAIIFLLY